MTGISAMAVAALCGTGPPTFENVTVASGIDRAHRLGPFTVALGAAVFDWDGDGYLDLYVAGDLTPNRLLRNAGPPGFGFEDVTLEADLDLVHLHNLGAVAADFTGDGRTDLLLIAVDPERGPTLLAGRADGRFVDETAFRVAAPRSGYETAAYGDPDGDGDLDLALVRWAYAATPSQRQGCLETLRLENRHGVLTWPGSDANTLPGCGFAAAYTDVDGDGDVDLFQVNDFGPWFWPNSVLPSQGLDALGALRVGADPSAALGLDSAVYGMGIAVGDLDGDAHPDYLVTSYGEDALLRGLPTGGFADVTHLWQAGSPLGLHGRRFKWGAAFFDADNDGDDDLAVAASRLDVALSGSAEPEASVLLVNAGEPPLADKAVSGGVATLTDDRVVLPFDVDRDGRLDLLVVGLDSTRLFRNITAEAGHWLVLRLRGTVSNREAVGARAWVTACGVTRFRELTGGGVPGGSPPPEIHVGLGSCAEAASVTIRWPSGRLQSFGDVIADTVTDLEEEAWLALSATQAAADGSSQVALTYRHDSDTRVAVSWQATTGKLDAPDLQFVGERTYQGALTAASVPGEAAITLSVDGALLAAHPRVLWLAEERAEWTPHPSPPYQGRAFELAVRLAGPDGSAPAGQVTVELEGANATSAPLGGGLLLAISPQATAETVTAQALVEGVPFGAPFVLPLAPRVDPLRSGLSLRRLAPGTDLYAGGHRFMVSPRDLTGWSSPLPDGAPPVTLLRDGSVWPEAPHIVSSWQGHARIYLGTLPAGKLPPGTYQVVVDGVTLEAQAVVTGANPKALDVSPVQSLFRFVDGHLHADGEDVVPLILALRDGQGQPLPRLEELEVGFVGLGCEVLEGSLRPYPFWDAEGYLVDVRVGTTPGPVSLALELGGEPTSLVATAVATPPAPYTPVLAKTSLAFFSEQDGTTVVTGTPADGVSRTRVRITPRDSSNCRVGSGIGLALATTGGKLVSLGYLGSGAWEAVLESPSQACLATLTVTAAVGVGQRRVTWPFTGLDGVAVDTPCAPAQSDPGPEGSHVEPLDPGRGGCSGSHGRGVAVAAALAALILRRRATRLRTPPRAPRGPARAARRGPPGRARRGGRSGPRTRVIPRSSTR